MRPRFFAACMAALVAFLFFIALPNATSAHVKWFSRFSFADPPRTLGEVITPPFLALAALSMIAIAVLVVIDRRYKHHPLLARVEGWFSRYQPNARLALRIGIGATLLMAWQADAILVPELKMGAAWVGWYQFALALLLIFPRTTLLAGIGILNLYLIGIFDNGFFYMLDYLHFVGIGYYFLVSKVELPYLRGTHLPVLYATMGFSLCWLALEKVIYPDWGLYLLEEVPMLSFGLPVTFFLLSAAFVEFTLGYLLIIKLLQRQVALLVTVVFFMTTLVFGKVEVIGHTALHAALIVFLLEGPGQIYDAPINLYKRLRWRVSFAVVNYALLLALLVIPYSAWAWVVYEQAMVVTPPVALVATPTTAPFSAARYGGRSSLPQSRPSPWGGVIVSH
jgi:hypothetical protein